MSYCEKTEWYGSLSFSTLISLIEGRNGKKEAILSPDDTSIKEKVRGTRQHAKTINNVGASVRVVQSLGEQLTLEEGVADASRAKKRALAWATVTFGIQARRMCFFPHKRDSGLWLIIGDVTWCRVVVSSNGRTATEIRTISDFHKAAWTL